MKLLRVLSLSAAVAAFVIPSVAHADTMVSGSGGKAFGGDLGDSRTTYGGALTFMGDGPFGFEIEGAYTPDFFGGSDFFREDNVSSLMGNVLLGTHFGSNHPGALYASLGGGLLKTRVTDADEFFDVDNNSWGVSGGVGAMGFFSDHIGVRGDVRYYRNLGDPEPDSEFDIDFGEFSFWRGTAGVVLKF